MIGLFVRPQTQRERNVVRFSEAVCEEERCVTILKTAVCRLETRYANKHLLKNTKNAPCKESYDGAPQVTQCGVNLVNLSLSY